MTRGEAIEILEEVRTIDDSMYQYNERYLKALDMAIKALEQTDVLDKIRAEIEEHILERLSDCGDDWFTAEKVNECLEIIDKYREEQE